MNIAEMIQNRATYQDIIAAVDAEVVGCSMHLHKTQTAAAKALGVNRGTFGKKIEADRLRMRFDRAVKDRIDNDVMHVWFEV